MGMSALVLFVQEELPDEPHIWLYSQVEGSAADPHASLFACYGARAAVYCVEPLHVSSCWLAHTLIQSHAPLPPKHTHTRPTA
jgi:hypothetical protein